MSLDAFMPLITAGCPAAVGLLAWSLARYRMPPELVAIVATIGLPLAGLWDPSLLPWSAPAGSWPHLIGWMVMSLVAVQYLRVKRTADVWLLGAVAGALPASCVAAYAAADARSAGRLAVVAAGGAAMSPIGGPMQWMLLPDAWSWWLISAPAGALAAVTCWRNNVFVQPSGTHVARPIIRVRWFLACLWMGSLLHVAGLTWALARLAQSPPELPGAAWAGAAWSLAALADPIVLADSYGRLQSLDLPTQSLAACLPGVTAPSLGVLIVAWWAHNYRSVFHGLPGILVGLAWVLCMS